MGSAAKAIVIWWMTFTSQPPTEENVLAAIMAMGIESPHTVLAQSIVETGNFRCRQCSMQYGNLFGFRTNTGYMRFEHWTGSVWYYKKWQDERYKGGDYYEFINRIGYASAPGYEVLVKKISSRIEHEQRSEISNILGLYEDASLAAHEYIRDIKEDWYSSKSCEVYCMVSDMGLEIYDPVSRGGESLFHNLKDGARQEERKTEATAVQRKRNGLWRAPSWIAIQTSRISNIGIEYFSTLLCK
jgi:hypothetical protein